MSFPEGPVVLNESQLKKIVSDAVEDIFTRLGIDANEPLEMQKDFQHLREWRQATAEVQSKGILTIVGLVVAGGCAALWLGVKGMLHITG